MYPLHIQHLEHKAYTQVVLRCPPLHREEGSGTASLLKLFCWNAIEKSHVLMYFYTYPKQHSDVLTAWNAQRAICYTRAHCVPVVVVTLAYCSHAAATKFKCSCSPGFLGNMNNLSNDAVPDPSSVWRPWRGGYHETNTQALKFWAGSFN